MLGLPLPLPSSSLPSCDGNPWAVWTSYMPFAHESTIMIMLRMQRIDIRAAALILTVDWLVVFGGKFER